MAQRLKHLPAMQETQVWSLGWEDPLEKEMAAHSSIPVWEIPWTEKPGRLQSTGLQRVRLSDITYITIIIILSLKLTHKKKGYQIPWIDWCNFI